MNVSGDERNRRVLVIDDNQAIHDDFRKILAGGPSDATTDFDQARAAFFGETPAAEERTGFEVDSAYQGQEGLEQVRGAIQEGRPYALAFVDLRMPPGWGGIETIAHLWEVASDLQVVVCTAYSDYSWDEIIAKLGQSDRLLILKKPFDNIEVFQLACALSEKWNLARQALHRVDDLEEAVERRTRELQEQQQQLQRAHSETKQLFEAISSILIGVDGEDKVAAWNATAERTFGIEKDNAVGRLFDDLGIQWDHAVIAECISQCRAANRPTRLDEVRFKQPDGRDGFLGMTLNPLNGGSDKRGGFLLVAADITGKKILQGQLAQSQKLESIGQLAAGIAHEINTPIQYVGDNVRFLSDSMDDLLSLIGSYRDLISEAANGTDADNYASKAATLEQEADLPYLEEELPKSIAQSLDGVGRVSTIVRAMKDFSHPGSEEMEAVGLNRAIESTVTVARNEWKYVAEMVTKFDPALPPVPCLLGEFNQVILNLIVNAAHAIAGVVGDDAAGKGTITISTRRDGGWAEIRISDTGTGIAEEHRSKVFDHFFTTKEVGKGTGQGLAIAYSVITEKHGGTITFETEPGKGTTFIIRLPIEPEAATAEEIPQHEEAHSLR